MLDCDLALSLLERTASASRSCCLDMQLFPMLPGPWFPAAPADYSKSAALQPLYGHPHVRFKLMRRLRSRSTHVLFYAYDPPQAPPGGQLYHTLQAPRLAIETTGQGLLQL